MSDTLITILTGAVIVVLLFAVPVGLTANQNDEIAESTIKAMVQEFVNKEAMQGKITAEDYQAFIQELNATGNTFEVEMEVQLLGDNPGVKGSPGTIRDTVGENVRYSEYTNNIVGKLESAEKQFLLHKGDYFIVSVKNTNITLGKKLQGLFYQVIGKDSSIIDTSASALVSVTGVK